MIKQMEKNTIWRIEECDKILVQKVNKEYVESCCKIVEDKISKGV